MAFLVVAAARMRSVPTSTGRDQCRRALNVDRFFCAKRVDDDSGQSVGRQIERVRNGCAAPPHHVVAAYFVEPEMAERMRQARQVVSIKSKDPLAMAALQTGQQDLQHFVRSTQTVEIAQQLAALRQSGHIKIAPQLGIYWQPRRTPGSMITHRDREDKDSRPFGIEHL